MIHPNHTDAFFECSVEDAEINPDLIEHDESVEVEFGAYNTEYDRCPERSPAFDWSCNWRTDHTGHHDAWFEGEGHHVAHWFNENADYLIPEELDLELA